MIFPIELTFLSQNKAIPEIWVIIKDIESKRKVSSTNCGHHLLKIFNV